MSRFARATLAGIGIGAALPLVASAQARSPELLVLSKAEHVLSIVDPATHAVIARVPSGPEPHEVVASDDGTRAYISNYGTNNTLTEVDLVARRPLATIDLGALRAPHGLAYHDGKVWFTSEAAKAIGRYDPASRAVDLVLGTGQTGTHMLVVSPDGRRVITTNIGSATVTVFEQRQGPRVDWDATVIPVGRGAEGFDVTPDWKEAWVANAQDGTISVIDLGAKRVVQTLAAEVRGANRLKFTPDGALAFVSTLAGDDLTVLRVATHEVVKRVPVGRAAGIQVQPDGARVYLASTPNDSVVVVDARSLAVVGRIAAGRQPDGLAWAVRR